MSNEIYGKVRQKIVGSFSDLWSDEELDAIIKKEVDAFFNGDEKLEIGTVKTENNS